MIDDLKDMLAEKDYRMINSAGTIVLKQKHNFILVMTPERLPYLLTEYRDFELDYLFIDEAHKISSRDSRSPFYYKVIDLVAKRSAGTHIIFSSPNIPNPGVYLNLIPLVDKGQLSEITCAYAPVSQTKYLVDLTANTIRSYNDYSNSFANVCNFSRTVDISELISLMDKNSQNIVYCNSTAKAVTFALDYAKKILLYYTNKSRAKSVNQGHQE